MQELADPALSLDRARQTWQQHGCSDKWIQQRMTGQETRNKQGGDSRQGIAQSISCKRYLNIRPRSTLIHVDRH